MMAFVYGLSTQFDTDSLSHLSQHFYTVPKKRPRAIVDQELWSHCVWTM